MKTEGNILRRCVLMLAGLFISGLGVSFSIKAELGTSPIACCPVIYSAPLKVSVGTAMVIMCALFVVVQIIIARKSFEPFQLLQLLVVFGFGSLTDVTSLILQHLPSELLILQIIYCALGILLLAFGIYLLLRADLLMLSPDAMLALISKKYGLDYGKMKIAMDVFLVVAASVGSLVMYGRLVQIGLGTLAAAILVGMVIRALKNMGGLNKWVDKLLM